MDIKERTRKELIQRIEKLEGLIAEKGIGSRQLKKAKRTQRNVNVGLVVGAATVVAGVVIWAASSE